MDDLGLVDPFTASVVSPTRLYLAEGLRFGDHSQEGTEVIRCVKLSLAEAVQKVIDSEISHGPSCVVILKTCRLTIDSPQLHISHCVRELLEQIKSCLPDRDSP
jgi:hypothetical protein